MTIASSSDTTKLSLQSSFAADLTLVKNQVTDRKRCHTSDIHTVQDNDGYLACL